MERGRREGTHEQLTAPARSMGIGAATAILVAGTAYGMTLGAGFLSLQSPEQPIGEPYFTVLEVLILLMAPAMVALMVAVHAWASPPLRAWSLASLCLMVMLATVTCCVHFVILTFGHEPALMHQPGMDLFLRFKWPSVAYALDILAWDVFFAMSMLLAAPVFRGAGLCRAIRFAMITTAALALAGLTGVFWGDMTMRDIGIVGYVGGFLVVAFLLLVLFLRAKCRPSS